MALDPEAVSDLRGRIAHDVDKGLIPAAQLALALDGEVVLSDSFGTATADDLLPTYSAIKVVVAAAIWRLVGEGRLTYETTASTVLPWFTGGGLDLITIEHLLVHTAGIASAPLGPPEWTDPVRRREKMASWYTTTTPGEEMAYHASSAHWVLAEVVAELEGADHCTAIHRLVTEPLGLPPMLGVDDTEQSVLDVVPVGVEPGADSFAVAEVTTESLARFNEHDVRLLGVPGGSGFSRAADLALLYQALLHNPGELFDPAVLADATGTVVVTQEDPLRMAPANRSRGLLIAGDDGLSMRRGFGMDAPPRSFGHDGAGGQVAWADPDSGLSCCFLTTGLDTDLVRQARRGVAISTRAMACVGR